MSFVVIHDLLGWIGDKKREDWIVVEGMHEAIIDRDTYDIVQEKVKSWKRPDAWDNFSLFAGLVKCGQCGSTLNIRWANQKGNERIYTCSRYNKYGVAHCTQHRIKYDTLYAVHSFFSLADFEKQLAVHNRRSNNLPMRPLHWLSPLEFLVQHV